MNIPKIAGWSLAGLLLASGFMYGMLPTITRVILTRLLNSYGMGNVTVQIDYPKWGTWTIPSLSFHISPASGPASIVIHRMELAYSLDSLLQHKLERVNIDSVHVEWLSSVFPHAPSPAQSSSPKRTGPGFALSLLRSDVNLPSLPFDVLQINRIDVANPLAPPQLQQLSLSASLSSLPKGYEGVVEFSGDGLPLNRILFSLERNGSASLSGIDTRVPHEPVVFVKMNHDSSNASHPFTGHTTINLQPAIQILAGFIPIPADYHAVTGTLTGTWQGAPMENPSPSRSSAGTLAGEFSLTARMPEWASFAQNLDLVAKGTFSVDHQAIHMNLQPASSGTGIVRGAVFPPSFHTILPPADQWQFEWTIPQAVHVSMPFQQDSMSLQLLTGQIFIRMQHSSDHLELLVTPKDVHVTSSGNLTGRAAMSSTLAFSPPIVSSLPLRSVVSKIEAILMAEHDSLSLRLLPSSSLQLRNVRTGGLHIPEISTRFPRGGQGTYHRDSRTWAFEIPESILALPKISINDQEWNLTPILTKELVVTHTREQWAMKGESHIKDVHPPAGTIPLPNFSWGTRFSADPATVEMHFSGTTVEHPLSFGGKLRMNLSTQAGSGTFTLQPIQFTPGTFTLSQMIDPWPYSNADITRGSVAASAEATFRHVPTATPPLRLHKLHAVIDLQKLEGFLSPTIFKGLTSHLEIVGSQDAVHLSPSPVHLQHIESAIDVVDTSFLVSSEPLHRVTMPVLSVSNLSTHLLGGTVTLKQATYHPAHATHKVPLHIQGLDLNEILRLEQQDTVTGTGTLDGVLPLLVSGTDIEVHQGMLQARPPGGTLRIELSEDTVQRWTKSQPNLEVVVKSLENFHYSLLKVGVNYEKTGILTLTTRLEGKNPDFRKGVPIHFNLNIEENVPALLQSLSLVQDLESQIEKMVTGSKGSSTQGKRQNP